MVKPKVTNHGSASRSENQAAGLAGPLTGTRREIAARALGQTDAPLFTTAPVAPGNVNGVLPEFGRHYDVRRIFGIPRGKLYEIDKLGLVKSVSLRRPGQKFSIRLWHLESIRAYLHSLMQDQSAEADQQQDDTNFDTGSGHVPKPGAAKEKPGDESEVGPIATPESDGELEQLRPVGKEQHRNQ